MLVEVFQIIVETSPESLKYVFGMLRVLHNMLFIISSLVDNMPINHFFGVSVFSFDLQTSAVNEKTVSICCLKVTITLAKYASIIFLENNFQNAFFSGCDLQNSIIISPMFFYRIEPSLPNMELQVLHSR